MLDLFAKMFSLLNMKKAAVQDLYIIINYIVILLTDTNGSHTRDFVPSKTTYLSQMDVFMNTCKCTKI